MRAAKATVEYDHKSREDNHNCPSSSSKPEEHYDEPKNKKFKMEPELMNESTNKEEKVKTPEEDVWKWWEEESLKDGAKWVTLEHRGPVFAPPYRRLPNNVRFYYDGKPFKLTEETEEAATLYGKMLNHDYCTQKLFNKNFFKDFRNTMTHKERKTIKDFYKCDFQEIFKYFQAESKKLKGATKEEKLAKRWDNEALANAYGFCIIDGHREKIGRFRLELPGLFCGRGDHPKMGRIKRRVKASDVIINCGRNSKIPIPPPGQQWKEVRHDNTVSWLASWVDSVKNQNKYILLNQSSKLRGVKDHDKYETARRLHKIIDRIRAAYRRDWKSKEMEVRQRAVALYFIDKLSLQAGGEKDENQAADTVGCCSLRVEHIQLYKELDDKEYVVIFDFPATDSIRYYNEVEVEQTVFKNLKLFMKNKKRGDDLFDHLNSHMLNQHLKELMDGLTTKLFRIHNASVTLQNQLDELTDGSATVGEKLLAYNRANRAVAVLFNNQRSVPKGHQQFMENLKKRICIRRSAINDRESEYYELKKAAQLSGSVKEKMMAERKGKPLKRLKDQLKQLELQEIDRDESKSITLGTSKLYYLDPRISVAWCKKHNVPIEKIFNKMERTKFLWAIHMVDKNYHFLGKSPVNGDDDEEDSSNE